MTTPGGVPNLPMGALTLDNIADALHDMSPEAMRSRAVERLPSIFNSSMGGNPASDLSFFGLLTQLWAGFNSAVANADPMDITGPDDLPGLLTNFIEELPIIGEFVTLLESIMDGTFEPGDVLTAISNVFNQLASMLGLSVSPFDPAAMSARFAELFPWAADILAAIQGTYSGEDVALQAVQEIFAPIRKLTQLVAGIVDGFPTLEELTDGWTTIPSANDILTAISDLIEDIVEAITDLAPSGGATADLQNALRNIPFLRVLGLGGPGDIGETIQQTWNQWIGGLVGELGSGAGLADLFNIGQDVSSRATKGLWSWDILGIRSNRDFSSGFLPTTQSPISLDTLALGSSTLPTITVTPTTAIRLYHRIREDADYGVVGWQGYGVTNVTDFRINIYRMNTLTGDETLVHAASTSQASLLSGLSTPQHTIYEFNPIPVRAGEVYSTELVVRGSGAVHTIMGTVCGLADQQVFPRRYSARRDSSSVLAPSTISTGFSYATDVPFIEFGVSSGVVNVPHSDETRTFNTVGSTSTPIPVWADIVEGIVLGGGGSGFSGSSSLGLDGLGGEPGVWATGTWKRGIHFSGASPTISVTVGAGGVNNGFGDLNGPGGDGGASSATVGANTISGTGGAAGDGRTSLNSDRDGDSPGNQSFGGVVYAGGGVQAASGSPGSIPGGGGSGGAYFKAGGDGAKGTVWLRFQQGESTSGGVLQTDPIGVTDSMTVVANYVRAQTDTIAITDATDYFAGFEFLYEFTTKAADSNLNGNTSDSGHTVTSNYGLDIEAVAQIAASPIDGTMVMTCLDTASDSSRNHLMTPDMGERVVFLAADVRFGAGSTDAPFMMGPWENWVAQDATTSNPAHILFYRDECRAQTYTNLAETNVWQTLYDPVPTGWQRVLVAIDPVASAVVVLQANGVSRAFTSPLASSLTDYSIGDWEHYFTNPDTDRRIEFARIGCATASGMSLGVAAAYDALLVAHGYGSAYTPPDTPTYLAAGSAEASSMTLPTHATGDLIVLAAYRDGGDTPPGLATGASWTDRGNNGANSNSVRAASKIAASSSEGSGTWTVTQTANHLQALVFSDAAVGAVAFGNGNSTTITVPSLTLQNTDGSSMVAVFVFHRSTNGTFSLGTLSGVTQRNARDTGTSVCDSATYTTNGGVFAFSGGTISYSGSASGWQAVAVEIKAV